MSNLTAFLSMVGACEGADYNTLYGGKPFASFDDHPRRAITANGYTSTAAGRYQILARTWDDFVLARGGRKFDQQGQDDCAVWLIERRGSLADVEAGRLDIAIQKCGAEWASLPGSPYHQPTRSMQYCLDYYTAAGGTLSTQEPAPIEHYDVPPAITKQAPPMGASLLLSLLPSVLQLFAPRAQAALDKVVTPTATSPGNTDIVANLVQTIFTSLVAATGKSDPIQAVAAVTDPNADKAKTAAIVAQVQDTALDYLDKLAPVLDKLSTYEKQSWDAEESSRDAAAKRGSQAQADGPLYNNPTFLISSFVLVMVAAVVFAVLFRGGFSTDMQAYVIGSVVGSAFAGVLGYWIGSSRQSGAKDVLLGEIAKSR